MQLIKILSSKYFLLILFVILFFATRLPGLGSDVINPDAVNWHYRTQQFVVGLKTGQFEKTYQHYHPGVTLMWVAGVPIEVIKQLNPEEVVYDHENFLTYHTAAKTVLVFVQLALTLASIYLLYRVFKVIKARDALLKSVLIATLFTFEPFFLGNSRLLHLDILVTLLLFNGLLLSYLSVKDYKVWYVLGAGVFLALAFLTKSVAIGGLLFALVASGGLIWYQDGFKKALKFSGLLISSYFLTLFLLFPAMWSDPGVLINIFTEGERIGIRGGHGQIFFGKYTRDPGAFYYLFVFLLKLTPFILFGAVLFIVSKVLSSGRDSFKGVINTILTSPVLYLTIFYVGYIVVMAFPTKKLDRYMLVVYPLLAMIAVLGYFEIYYRLNQKRRAIFTVLTSILVLFFIVFPIVKQYPYYFTYTNPIFGSTQNANKIIAQKPFGVGVVELREFIFDKYGEEFGEFPRLGFIDKKPMSAIYRNSRIFDARVNGASDYDLLILAVNEEIPENALDSSVNFKKDNSLYINGLEYWRVYVKEDKSQN